MIASGQAGLEIAEQGVGPLELRQVLRLSLGHNGRLVRVSGLGARGETGQAIGQHRTFPAPDSFGFPIGNRLQAKPRHGRELGAQGGAVLAVGDGRYERNLVLGAATSLAAATLTAQVSVIDLDLAFEDMVHFPLGYGLHQFMVDKPSGRVAHAQLPLQGKHRRPGLGLTDKVESQKQDHQSKFRALEDGPGNRRGLMATGAAREGAPPHDIMRRAVTARAAKGFRPAGFPQRRLALGRGSASLEELRHRRTGPELDSIHRHGIPLRIQLRYRVWPLAAYHVSLAGIHCYSMGVSYLKFFRNISPLVG